MVVVEQRSHVALVKPVVAKPLFFIGVPRFLVVVTQPDHF
jgi:hypothetical protein